MGFLTSLRFVCLALSDRLLGTHLVEREMARLQREMEIYEAQASIMRRQMEELSHLLHVIQVALCVCYLYRRWTLRPTTWFHFAPAEGADEERDLDMLISRLVRHGLAAVRTEPIGEGAYLYHLRPD